MRNSRVIHCANPCLAVFLLVCLSLAMHAGLSCAADQAPSWLEQRKAGHSRQLQDYEQKENRAREALNKAVEAEGLALELEDRQALSVAQRAKDIADKTLRKLGALIDRERRRLAATEKVSAAGVRENIAMLTDKKGPVLRKSRDGWVPLDDAPLRPGDEIRTEAGGYAELVFNDGSRVHLGEKSTFSINPADDSSYTLSLGKLKAQVEKMANRRYAVRTPTACACVRGTEFIMETLSDGSTMLMVLKGEVDFIPRDRETGVLIRQGERAVMSLNGSVTGPEKFDLQQEAAWWDQ